MKRLFLIIALSVLALNGMCQDSTLAKNGPNAETEKYWKNWVNDLYEVGVEQTKDSIKISEDVKKIILDTNYQKIIYPKAYTMEAVAALFKQMEIKKGMWYLINIYNERKEYKESVLKIILPFEQGLEMDKVLISSFYTYAMTDPKVGTFKKGKLEITRPDILEQKFNAVKEMSAYIVSQRKKPNKNADKALGQARSEQLKKLGIGSVNKIN